MKKTLLSAVAAAALTATSVAAETFTISSWVGEKHPLSVDYADFIDRVEGATDGRMSFDLYVGGSLLPAAGALEGIASGVADIGNNIGAYTPADLPINNLINDVAFSGSNAIATGFAITEMTLLNAAAKAEWDKQDVVYLSGFSTPVYYLACMDDIKTFEDMSGRKIRTAGGTHVAWVQFAGGVPVSVPFSDVYSGLQRGSIDCVMMNPTDMGGGFQIAEVAKNYTLLPMGTHASGSQFMFNRDKWTDLSEGDRQILLNETARQLVRLQLYWEGITGAGLEAAREKNVEIFEPHDSMTSAIATFKSDYFKQLPSITEEKRGIPADQGEELISDYLAIYDKWQKLLDGVDSTDEEAVLELVQREIYSKLDTATFGM